MLTFRLIKKCMQDASDYIGNDVDFLLEENDWNDFGYHTTYYLHITGKRLGKNVRPECLGIIQIMKHGQKEHEAYLIRKNLGGYSKFSELPKDFYSLTFSIDLCKSLARYLNENERLEFINALHLITKEEDDYYSIVKDDDCFQTSLLRDASMDSFYLLKVREILFQEGMQYSLREKSVKINYIDSESPVILDFSLIKGDYTDVIPNGIIVFIGKNGSGKSTALYRLARLLYETPKTRNLYKETLGTIEPSDLGISQLMIFSYSPFDNFMLPGEHSKNDLKKWSEEIERCNGRFIYCGLRDVSKEVEEILEQDTDNEEDIYNERANFASFKNPMILAQESLEAYKIIETTKNLSKDWDDFLEKAKESQPEIFQKADELGFSTGDFDSSCNKIFCEFSTGHKFFFHAMLHLIAYCEENAIILFDEPENHIQSPLLSFMLAEFRRILQKRKSVMLIATHSPVILQETMSKNVRIVRRNNDKVSFRVPIIETYGENLGAISSEVFDLNTDRVHFFNAIDEVYEKNHCKNMLTAKDVVNKINSCMGGISSQTIHYVVSKYISEKEN